MTAQRPHLTDPDHVWDPSLQGELPDQVWADLVARLDPARVQAWVGSVFDSLPSHMQFQVLERSDAGEIGFRLSPFSSWGRSRLYFDGIPDPVAILDPLITLLEE